MSYIIKCDRCGKTGEQGNGNHMPNKWKGVALSVRFASGGSRNKSHQFCQECAERLGIGGYEPPDDETSSEKLVAILESMVDEAVEERG